MNFQSIDEYESGIACPNCWGAGKAFGDIPTPERITMVGSGFVGADLPLNTSIILPQVPMTACQWAFDNGTIWGIWKTGAVNTNFQMGLTGQPASYNRNEGLCVLVSTFGAQSVTVAIDEPPTPEHKIAKDQNFSPNDITSYDNFGAINSTEVTAICRRADRIRLFFEYEPEY